MGNDKIQGGAASCGLQRANWTYAEFVPYLYQQRGIATSETALREFCYRHQIRPYRPPSWELRGDPQRQAQAQSELAELKKSPGGDVPRAESG